MEKYNRICEYCGTEFITDAKHKKQRFCSEPCRYHHRRQMVKPKKVDNILTINEMAREKHMTYGKYKAMQYMERMREEQCTKGI